MDFLSGKRKDPSHQWTVRIAWTNFFSCIWTLALLGPKPSIIQCRRGPIWSRRTQTALRLARVFAPPLRVPSWIHHPRVHIPLTSTIPPRQLQQAQLDHILFWNGHVPRERLHRAADIDYLGHHFEFLVVPLPPSVLAHVCVYLVRLFAFFLNHGLTMGYWMNLRPVFFSLSFFNSGAALDAGWNLNLLVCSFIIHFLFFERGCWTLLLRIYDCPLGRLLIFLRWVPCIQTYIESVPIINTHP